MPNNASLLALWSWKLLLRRLMFVLTMQRSFMGPWGFAFSEETSILSTDLSDRPRVQ